MIILDIFIILIFVLLLVFGFLAFLAWQKISVFLTWNTRYNAAEYETAVTTPKNYKPAAKASKTATKGRSIIPVADFVDLADLDPEIGMEAVERLADGAKG